MHIMGGNIGRGSALKLGQTWARFDHGHTPRSEAELLGNRIGIDTGAYFSGRLTCVQLMGERMRLIQVSDH